LSNSLSATTVTRKFTQPDDTITLDETARHRRRVLLVSDAGIEFLLNFPETRLLKHGDGLMLSDGRVIEVLAAPEKLYRVKGRDPLHLLRLAWHMGNRHLPSQIKERHILIRRDHVIKEMLQGLGADVTEIDAPFDPEGGAYDGHHYDGHHGE